MDPGSTSMLEAPPTNDQLDRRIMVEKAKKNKARQLQKKQTMASDSSFKNYKMTRVDDPRSPSGGGRVEQDPLIPQFILASKMHDGGGGDESSMSIEKKNPSFNRAPTTPIPTHQGMQFETLLFGSSYFQPPPPAPPRQKASNHLPVKYSQPEYESDMDPAKFQAAIGQNQNLKEAQMKLRRNSIQSRNYSFGSTSFQNYNNNNEAVSQKGFGIISSGERFYQQDYHPSDVNPDEEMRLHRHSSKLMKPHSPARRLSVNPPSDSKKMMKKIHKKYKDQESKKRKEESAKRKSQAKKKLSILDGINAIKRFFGSEKTPAEHLEQSSSSDSISSNSTAKRPTTKDIKADPVVCDLDDDSRTIKAEKAKPGSRKKSIVHKEFHDVVEEEDCSDSNPDSDAGFKQRDILAEINDESAQSPGLKKAPSKTKLTAEMEDDVHQIKTQQQWVIKQNSQFRHAWNSLIVLITIVEGFYEPFEMSFLQTPFNELYSPAHFFVDFMYFLDIIFNSRTTYFDVTTGDQIKNSKDITRHYFTSFGFWIDLIATIPVHYIISFFPGNPHLVLIILLKMLKIFRVRWEFALTNQSEIFKLSMQLLNLLFFLLLYTHSSGCFHFYVANIEKRWKPTQAEYAENGVNFYDQDAKTRYLTSFYMAVLMLTGDDITPEGNFHIGVTCFLSITGSLIIANIFGTIAVVVSTLNRKTQKFQEKIDVANTSMRNMKLPNTLQDEVREFMMSTQNNLDNQKELDNFMMMISPSLRNKVTKLIFMNAISRNPILQASTDLIDFLINDITTLLYLPEDRIVYQGQNGDSLFLIAKGDCTVWVKDHLKVNRYVKQICQGEYFGEVAILTDTCRTATVKSSNYCTLACINKKIFFDLCGNYPEIIIKMKEKTLEYKDPWKRFKIELLKQIDFFKDHIQQPQFLDDIQYHMHEEHVEKGTEIVSSGDLCSAITFIVEGHVNLVTYDANGNEIILEQLNQGDMIGQYSMLFNEEFMFSAQAQTNARILVLSQEFFISQKDMIDGLEDAVLKAEEFVEEFGVPICDFKLFGRKEESNLKCFKRAVQRARLLKKSIWNDPNNASPNASLRVPKKTVTNIGGGIGSLFGGRRMSNSEKKKDLQQTLGLPSPMVQSAGFSNAISSPQRIGGGGTSSNNEGQSPKAAKGSAWKPQSTFSKAQYSIRRQSSIKARSHVSASSTRLARFHSKEIAPTILQDMKDRRLSVQHQFIFKPEFVHEHHLNLGQHSQGNKRGRNQSIAPNNRLSELSSQIEELKSLMSQNLKRISGEVSTTQKRALPSIVASSCDKSSVSQSLSESISPPTQQSQYRASQRQESYFSIKKATTISIDEVGGESDEVQNLHSSPTNQRKASPQHPPPSDQLSRLFHKQSSFKNEAVTPDVVEKEDELTRKIYVLSEHSDEEDSDEHSPKSSSRSENNIFRGKKEEVKALDPKVEKPTKLFSRRQEQEPERPLRSSKASPLRAKKMNKMKSPAVSKPSTMKLSQVRNQISRAQDNQRKKLKVRTNTQTLPPIEQMKRMATMHFDMPDSFFEEKDWTPTLKQGREASSSMKEARPNNPSHRDKLTPASRDKEKKIGSQRSGTIMSSSQIQRKLQKRFSNEEDF